MSTMIIGEMKESFEDLIAKVMYILGRFHEEYGKFHRAQFTSLSNPYVKYMLLFGKSDPTDKFWDMEGDLTKWVITKT